MAVAFNPALLEEYLAPGIASFDAAEIPDVAVRELEAGHWIDNHFLNSVLRGALNRGPLRAYVQHFLRRAEAAFSEHELARTATNAYLQNRQSPSRYSRALLHWEFFLGQSWHAYALLREFANYLAKDDPSATKVKIFESGDGSVEQRVNTLYNAAKHVETRITNGQLPEDSTSPVWMTNRGLECTDASLTYEETGEVLTFLAKWADILVDPIEMTKKLSALP